MIYLVRERHHVWASLPGKWMMLASALDILAVILLASFGVLMQAIPLWLTLGTLGVIALALLALDFFKVWLLRKI